MLVLALGLIGDPDGGTFLSPAMAAGGRAMSDAQIRAALKEYGIDMPVVESTRTVCLAKLAALSAKGTAAGRQHASSPPAQTQQIRATARQSPPRALSPEAESAPQLFTTNPVGQSAESPTSGFSNAHQWNQAASSGTASSQYRHNSAAACHTAAQQAQTQTPRRAHQDAAAASQAVDSALEELQGQFQECKVQSQRQRRPAEVYSTPNGGGTVQRGGGRAVELQTGVDEHMASLRDDMYSALKQPSRIMDTCFLAGYDKKVYANRTICAVRCTALVDLMWRQDEFHVEVMSVDNTHMATVNVCLDHSVRALKELVFAATGVPTARQRLIFSSTELSDPQRLSDYGMVKDCAVQIVQSVSKGDGSDEEAAVQYPIVSVVDMSHIDHASLCSFLLYLYTGTVDITKDNICGVFILAQHFNMSLLRKECLVLLRDSFDQDNVFHLVQMAHTHRCDDLSLMCLSFIAANGGLDQLKAHLPELYSDLMQFWSAHQQ